MARWSRLYMGGGNVKKQKRNGSTGGKNSTQNIFQWLQERKYTVLQGHENLQPGSADEGLPRNRGL